MRIEDTSKRKPIQHVALAMSVGADDYITGMEAAGGAQMAASELLPTDLGFTSTKADYEALGFTFGEVVDSDPMFQHAILPEGWKKQRTDHSMWTEIVDERGVQRVAIFYKAAFYDRSANMSIVNVGARFVTGFQYGEPPEPIPWDILYPEECTQALDALRRIIDDIERHPHIYDKDGTVRPRVEAELAAHS